MRPLCLLVPFVLPLGEVALAQPGWPADAVAYRIDTLAADGLQPFLARAAALDSLGITLVWLPLHAAPLGATAADDLLRDALAAFHARGLRVMLGATFDPARDQTAATTRRWMDPDGDGDPSDGVAAWHVATGERASTDAWREWNALVRALRPDAYTVADDALPAEAGFSATGDDGVPRLHRPTPDDATTDAARETWRMLLTWQMAARPGVPVVGPADDAPDRLAFMRRAVALRRSDAVLRRGSVRVLAVDSANGTLAVERALDGERRVVALNRSDASQFLALPREGARVPLVPVFASTGDARAIPALVFVFDEASGSAVGLRLPARTAAVFRPAEPADVRPGGLHE